MYAFLSQIIYQLLTSMWCNCPIVAYGKDKHPLAVHTCVQAN